MIYFLKKVFSITLIFVGSFLLLGFFLNMNDPEKSADISGDLLALVFMAILPIGLGIWLFRKNEKAKIEQDSSKLEIALVRLANQKGGTLAIPDVVSGLKVRSSSARKIMEELHVQGVFEVDVTRSGALVYNLVDHSEPVNKKKKAHTEEYEFDDDFEKERPNQPSHSLDSVFAAGVIMAGSSAETESFDDQEKERQWADDNNDAGDFDDNSSDSSDDCGSDDGGSDD